LDSSGVITDKNEDASIELKHVCLVDQILGALGLDTKLATHKGAPVGVTPLVKNGDGEEPQGSFSYSSVFIMFMYLSSHSPPVIAYAVNCCARHMLNPRMVHKKALKCIGRYLTVNRDRVFEYKTRWQIED
jgi:hypothetical protein